MIAFVLSDAAETDLRGIIRYTRKHWGDAQVRRYIVRLEQGIARLAAGLGAFKDMSSLYPALRMSRCEHHYVFCLLCEHERTALMTRLAARLDA